MDTQNYLRASQQPTSNMRPTSLLILLSGICSVIITLASYLFGTVDRDFVFNSDSMYLPMLFDDLFKENGSFSAWYLTPAPGFFPDMLLFFISRFLSKNTLLNFALFAIVQVGLSYLSTLLMIRNFELNPQKRQAHYFTFSLFFLSAIAFFSFRGYVPYVHIFLPVYRFGAIFNTLILTTCLFWAFNQRHIIAYFGIGLICSLGIATDLMFLPMAIIPAIASIIITHLICKHHSKKPGIFVLISITLSSVLGWFIKQLSTRNTMSHYIGFGYTSPWGQLKILASLMIESFLQHPLIPVITLAFYILLILKLLAFLKSKSRKEQDASLFKKLYVLLFLLISPLITSAVVVWNGVITGAIHELRYVSNFYWFPICFSWMVFHFQWMRDRSLKILIIGWLTAIFLHLFSTPIGSFKTNYYPPIAECVDAAIAQYEEQSGERLDEGLSLYWEAKLISHFSQKDMSVLQVAGDLSPYLWIINEDWYTDQVYDFAVLAHDSPQAKLGPTVPYQPSKDIITALNGAPKATQMCFSADGRKFEIMLYGAEQLRVKP